LTLILILILSLTLRSQGRVLRRLILLLRRDRAKKIETAKRGLGNLQQISLMISVRNEFTLIRCVFPEGPLPNRYERRATTNSASASFRLSFLPRISF
jgi:hypothetical protein